MLISTPYLEGYVDLAGPRHSPLEAGLCRHRRLQAADCPCSKTRILGRTFTLAV